ncbi:protein PML-like [Saccostrea cucullata]|uniref:protein PML-like n=1 Tax=Saccostrea cuccullata TaxID=36930 RepID=UPI002ED0A16E
MVNGKEVETETVNSGLSKFLDWLKFYKKVILITHSGKNSDFPVFMTALASVDHVSELCDVVIGFVDSLPLLKKIFPGESSYKQENLVRSLLAATYDAHNALEDVRSLCWLMKHEKITDKYLADFSFSPEAVKIQLVFNREKTKNIGSSINCSRCDEDGNSRKCCRVWFVSCKSSKSSHEGR